MGRGLKLADLAFLGRVGNQGVTPNSFPGLLRWYRADDFVGVDGNSVGGGANNLGPWVDRTGSGDNAAIAASGPLYKTNIVGTMPVIRFTTQFLNFAPGAVLNFTFIAAVKPAPAATDQMVMQGAVPQMRMSFGGDKVRLFYDGTGGGQAGNAWGAPDNFNTFTLRRTGTTVSFRENKTARGSFVYGAGANVTFNQIGSSSLGGGIDLGELLIYNQLLSDADVDALYDQYLKPRWTTLP